jgi:hypothetical protein
MNKGIEGTVKRSDQVLHYFMISDIFGAETLPFIRSVTEAIEGFLTAFIANSLEAVEFC